VSEVAALTVLAIVAGVVFVAVLVVFFFGRWD
jgi:hypothetical protein